MNREQEQGAEEAGVDEMDEADVDKDNMRKETVQDTQAPRTDRPDTESAGKVDAMRNQMKWTNRMKSRMQTGWQLAHTLLEI